MPTLPRAVRGKEREIRWRSKDLNCLGRITVADSLHANTHARASSKRHEEFVEVGDLLRGAEPALRVEDGGLGVDGRVGHDGGWSHGGWSLYFFSLKSRFNYM